MQPITFSLQFNGQAAPMDEAPGVMKASTTAPAGVMQTRIDADGVGATVEPADGPPAKFESVVTMTGEQTFVESGTITYGDGGTSLTFDTIGEGRLGGRARCPGCPPARCSGGCWRAKANLPAPPATSPPTSWSPIRAR